MSKSDNNSPSQQAVKRVLNSFLIFEVSELLAPLSACEIAAPIARKLISDTKDGLQSTISAGTLPFQLVNHSVHQRHFDRIHTAERIRHLRSDDDDEEEVRQSGQAALSVAKARMNEFLESPEGTAHIRDGIVYDLNSRLGSEDVATAAGELLIQTLISVWSVFESSARTFIISWINQDPNQSSALLSSSDLKSFFSKQTVDIDVIREHGFNLTQSMGDILFLNRRIDNLTTIRAILKALFNDAGVRSGLGDDLWMLNQRRHLLVHKRGIVDREYIQKTKDATPLGIRITITTDDLERYIKGVQAAAIAIAVAADRHVSTAI